ncbi:MULTISPECIES: helix-hairpin-helix domain-containing protein [unclassified Caballeronia]|uniref:ComEA family DNA-binding protein n=1 Tax=unclassified Caballeronia TaxID=2646786 RepID=UPI0028625554|nr:MULTISPECIES: helix-hairpin-helix domain-containing protein [unclassified Caballeronia]MDR5813659.1 helix-hairpin-helix domain-containing protein [Caballeronia sp. LZ033]MDR5820415.1 helix-hairpin-helix domain-containing protein [Caballeronia sp. LZ043]MDR5878232.1 helix-hairpin-helix domain-containing protein [Caballeronia sp. LZ032]
MLKKLLMLCFAFMLSIGAAFAAVDVNTADQAALESVKGLGPVKSKAIVDERTKNGPFKDADDLATRVKGLGTKSVANLEQNGLTIGGSSLPPSGKTARPTTTQGGSAAPNSTVKSSTAATAATSPAATTAQTPAAAPASGTKASKKSKKDSAAAAAAASGPAMAASEAKPAKAKRSKKDKAASAAAASQ